MSKPVNDAPSASRQFVAQPPFWGSKVASITTPAWQKNPLKSHALMAVGVLAFTAVVSVPFLGVQSLTEDSPEWIQSVAGHGFLYLLLALLVGGVYGWYWWSRRHKIVVSVTNDGLTVSTRPGEVFSFNDVKLGTWGQTGGATMGTALHLHSGSNRFILGGRDRRVTAGTRLEAPDVGYGLEVDVDAWLPASEFEEILTLAGCRSGLDVRPPVPGELTRCLLFTNPLLVQEIGSFAFRKRNEFMRSLSQPRMAIDVSPDSIRVIDPNTNALIASVSPGQVAARPVVFRPTQRHLVPNLGHLMSDAATNYWSTAVGMYVSIPGMAPLSIGCRDTASGLDHRFSWPDDVPAEHARADYEVSGTDWLTLVEKFGLASYLGENADNGGRSAHWSSGTATDSTSPDGDSESGN
jgi:hypothetical protein